MSEFALNRIVSCPQAVVQSVMELSKEGAPTGAIAAILEASADVAELRATRVQAELVWSGPEEAGAHSRDTMAVLDELFSQAVRDVVVSTFVVRQPDKVFRTLAARMDDAAALRVRIFLHIGRQTGDTSHDSELVREFADSFRRSWPGSRMPELFYDPRGTEQDGALRATWHAKCVLVDDECTFVTSANFTDWAQTRNVEAGALVRGRAFNAQLRQQLDGSVRAGLARRVPGF